MSERNKLKPAEDATGNHTVFVEDMFGKIVRYATYVLNLLNPAKFDESKRVDLAGKGHFNKKTKQMVETPHVHEDDAEGGVRDANDDEIPKRSK